MQYGHDGDPCISQIHKASISPICSKISSILCVNVSHWHAHLNTNICWTPGSWLWCPKWRHFPLQGMGLSCTSHLQPTDKEQKRKKMNINVTTRKGASSRFQQHIPIYILRVNYACYAYTLGLHNNLHIRSLQLAHHMLQWMHSKQMCEKYTK